MALVRAGRKVRAADFLVQDWQDFSPVWTGSGSNPVLGNGTLTARYCQVGNIVFYQGRLAPGSTTTFGSGTYRVSLPVTAANLFSSNGIIGSLWIRDASAGDFQAQAINNGTYFEARPGAATFGGNAIWAATTPMTMVNGDWVSWNLTYEAA